jgi:diguanylate cyclase (GGDEF)-like protein
MIVDKEYRILVVDDAKDTQMLLEFDLSAAGYQVTCCDSGEDGLASLATQEIDLILLDMYMPGLSGLETLAKIRAQTISAEIPVIMLSASTDEDEVVAALELGAGDYVTKPYVAKVLLARMRTAIRLKEKTAQLAYLAKTDFLTGINNRGSFFELSNNAISLANRAGQPLVVAMFDIDFFKKVNDNYGHDAGDQVLRAFSHGMTEVFRVYDIIGRVGGEEFAVCLPNTNRQSANVACERLRYYIEKLSVRVISENDVESDINITVSIGLVLAENSSSTIDELLKQADTALYYAKEHGRNQVVDARVIATVDKNHDSDDNDQMVVSLRSTDDIEKSNPLQESIMTTNYDGIDFDVGVSNVLGDEALFKEILVMFYQDHHLDGDKLASAIQEQDIDSVKHIVHTLKGVACSVGAMDLFEVTKVLDAAINKDKREEFEYLFSKLSPEISRVMQGIKLQLDVS